LAVPPRSPASAALAAASAFVGLKRDDAVGQLVAGFELSMAVLVASTLDTFLSRMALARPAGGQCERDRSWLLGLRNEHAAEASYVGPERQLEGDLAGGGGQDRDVRLCGSAAAPGGMSR
jgi:hypothetical protein